MVIDYVLGMYLLNADKHVGVCVAIRQLPITEKIRAKYSEHAPNATSCTPVSFTSSLFWTVYHAGNVITSLNSLAVLS